jgi:CBS domain-containing protein
MTAPKGVTMRVEELMTSPVVTVSPQTPLKTVAHLLVENGIAGVPVCDEDGRVVGVVSEGDIVARERGEHAAGRRSRLLPWLLDPAAALPAVKLEARTAGDAMTSPAITIESWQTVSDAVAIMLDRDVERLPVLRDGRLVGIVTRADLVGAFSRSDEEIEHEIREEVLLRSFWVQDDDIQLTVRNGEVALTGVVESELMTELVPEAIRRVPGVVAVETKLRARPAPHEVTSYERLMSPR